MSEKRDGEDVEKTTAYPRTIVLLHSAPDIPLNGAPHSLRAYFARLKNARLLSRLAVSMIWEWLKKRFALDKTKLAVH